jgi:hypothetical protein
VPASAAVIRERCARGWKGWPCKKRTCSICSLTWARDWRRVLFENLKALDVPVALWAVTPPGQAELPYDKRVCAHHGPHKQASALGVASTRMLWLSGLVTCRSGGSGSTTPLGTPASARWAAACLWRRERGSRRLAALGTSTVFALHSPNDVRVAECYLRHVERLAPRHRFGFVGRTRGVSMQILSPTRAAAYLSSYLSGARVRRRRCRRTRGTLICRTC